MTVRSAVAVRPLRPITLPRSSGCTRTSSRAPRRVCLSRTVTSSGCATMPRTRCSSASASTSALGGLGRFGGGPDRGGRLLGALRGRTGGLDGRGVLGGGVATGGLDGGRSSVGGLGGGRSSVGGLGGGRSSVGGLGGGRGLLGRLLLGLLG